MKVRFFLVFICVSYLAGCRPTNRELTRFIDGQKAVVFIFLAPDCPLSQNYTLTLNQLHWEFRNKDMRFYGVVAGQSFRPDEILEFKSKYKIGFPVLEDPAFDLADSLGATKTPEAFVVDAAGQTIYKGAIDDWAVQLGVHRRVVTRHYLRDVLAVLDEGRGVSYAENPAVGCFIERRS